MSKNPTALAATSANNPYQLEELFVKFHRTPAGHRLAVAHRTAHPRRPGRRAAGGWTPGPALTWAGSHPRRPGRRGLGRAALPPVHHPAAWCVLARHRLQRLCYEARLHTRSGRLPLILVDPADQGRRTHLGAVPRGHLRRGLRRPHRRAARRLLRPRRAGHPQPPLVPPDHHRHHPPRHARGPRASSPPRWSGSPRTTTSASSSWSPPRTPPTRASPPPNPARRSPAYTRGPPAPTPEGGICHDCHRHPAAAAGPHLPVLHVRPGAPGPRRVRRARPRQPGRTEHAARRRARRGQVLRAEPDHRARRAVP